MKKMILMFALLSLPAFATDIPYTNDSYTSSTCDSGVLQHDSGTVRLRARYEPNTMNIRWYNNNTEIIPTNAAANTCEYDDVLTLPEIAPQRTGYTFAGWHVRPTMDFGTLDFSNRPLSVYGKGNKGYCGQVILSEDHLLEGSGICNQSAEFIELQANEWKANFSNGTLYGMAKCSKKPGDEHNSRWPVKNKSDWQEFNTSTLENYTGEDAAATKLHCWCKATGWKEQNQTTTKSHLNELGWIYNRIAPYESSCFMGCAFWCSYNIFNGYFRQRLNYTGQ